MKDQISKQYSFMIKYEICLKGPIMCSAITSIARATFCPETLHKNAIQILP